MDDDTFIKIDKVEKDNEHIDVIIGKHIFR